MKVYQGHTRLLQQLKLNYKVLTCNMYTNDCYQYKLRREHKQEKRRGFALEWTSNNKPTFIRVGRKQHV